MRLAFPTIPELDTSDSELPPSTPIPQSGRVGLLLKERTDAELIQFGRAHAKAMLHNALFPQPLPSTEDFDESLDEFAQSVTELQNLRLLVQSLTLRKDQLRSAFEKTFARRGRYVELASDGNLSAIATTALPERRKASKSVGLLSWPTNFELLLSPRSTSTLIATWDRVRGARSYVLEIAEVIEGQPRDWKLAWVGGKTKAQLKGLTPGKTYALRLATIGGSTGQSEWSPPVTRMVA